MGVYERIAELESRDDILKYASTSIKDVRSENTDAARALIAELHEYQAAYARNDIDKDTYERGVARIKARMEELK